MPFDYAGSSDEKRPDLVPEISSKHKKTCDEYALISQIKLFHPRQCRLERGVYYFLIAERTPLCLQSVLKDAFFCTQSLFSEVFQ